jgi:hypothetical protein
MSGISLSERLVIRETPREHFRRAIEDELSKFERKERAFLKADREERAARLKLPVGKDRTVPSHTARR